jgi:hypothetical protein
VLNLAHVCCLHHESVFGMPNVGLGSWCWCPSPWSPENSMWRLQKPIHTHIVGFFLHYYKSLYHVEGRALHWVPMPMPMPTDAHGFWVGIGAMLLFMGRHGWASVLCIPASSFKLESNFSDAGNTLTKKCSRLKSATLNDLLFVRSNQDLVYVGNTYYTFLNTWMQFE